MKESIEIDPGNADIVPLVSYTRGNDLSGAFQGAGGTGGLLARTTYGQELPGAPTTSFYHADANGNVTALMYPNEQLAAKYWYDPFGNMLAMSGPLRDFNKYRFSSKEWEPNAGLYYYGYRFYNPNLQRWVNRDPLNGDDGFDLEAVVGENLYEFSDNNSISYVDFNGMQWVELPEFIFPETLGGPPGWTCSLTSSQTYAPPPGGQGPSAKVCAYSCLEIAGEGYIQGGQSVTKTVQPCQSCPSGQSVANGFNPPPPPHHQRRGRGWAS